LTIIVETNDEILTKEKNSQQNSILVRFGVGALLGAKVFEKVGFSC
jgi:predicted nucleic acid-binding Zn ribbon protein